MGTDIHGIFQAKKDGVWQDIESKFKEDRNYFLFAWLGNVRNGHGFAGIKTHEPLVPLSDCRGFPEDFQIKDEYHKIATNALRGSGAKYYVEEDNDPAHENHLLLWMGDHSYSWVSADEVLDARTRG